VTPIAADHVIRVPAIPEAGAATRILAVDDRPPRTMPAIHGAGS